MIGLKLRLRAFAGWSTTYSMPRSRLSQKLIWLMTVHERCGRLG